MGILMERLIKDLEEIVGVGDVLTADEDLLCYSSDMSPLMYKPDVLVFAKSTEEVSRVLSYANRNRIPVTPRGAGTSVVASVLPRRGGIVLDLTKMDRVKEVRPEDLYAVVEPGVVLDRFNLELAKYGLFFPPDPGSSSTCTLGGMAATNASGIRAAKYGTMKDWVYGLEVVLANGDVLRVGSPVPKASSGYNLVQLFIGSEGTLGVITELTLKLAPLPPYRATLSAYFDSLENAGRAVTEILLAGVRPAAMELLDRSSIRVINEVFKLGVPEFEGLIVMELDGAKESVLNEIDRSTEACRKWGGRDIVWTDDPTRSMALWRARKALVPSLARLKAGYTIIPLAEDPGLPISQIADTIKECQRIGEKYGIGLTFFGHLGDGNLHPVMLIDPTDPEQWGKVVKVEEEIINVLLRRRGVLSAEHGIGVVKSPFVGRTLGLGLEVMRRIKQALDPNNILNPGKMGLEGLEREDPSSSYYALLKAVKEGMALQALKNEIIKCFRCGFCRAACPTFNYAKREPFNARGRVLLAYFYLTGRLNPSEKLLELFSFCTLCAHCTMVCPPGVKVAEIIEAAKRDLASSGFVKEGHRAIARNIVETGNIYGSDPHGRDELAVSLEAA
ncbi:MAG: FAD-linked oxidase C-terminal domain-containing protein [Candidatus Nezhaarchaeales archaeon]